MNAAHRTAARAADLAAELAAVLAAEQAPPPKRPPFRSADPFDALLPLRTRLDVGSLVSEADRMATASGGAS